MRGSPAALERLAPAALTRRLPKDGRCLCLGAGAGRADPGGACRQHRPGAAQGHRKPARHAARQHRAFRQGLPANNALLWGARGMGKSSLVKAVHDEINARPQRRQPAGADRGASRGYRQPAPAPAHCCAPASAASCSIATIFPSTRTTPATNRSRRRWKAASKAGRRMCCSTPPPTAAI